MENSFKSIIDRSKSILILIPVKPYLDQVAAGLALFLALREEKEVQISCPTPMIVEFNRLIGVNKIAQDLGSKNLMIRFVNYKANDIERVSYDIEDGQFRLTVIPKPRIIPPTKDQIELLYSGVSADTVILVGGANESHFPAISSKDLAGVNLIHIGTRDISLAPDKSVISFARPASSVSEIVANLIKESALRIDSDTATNLLMGIDEGSNSFSSTDVSPDTFALVSELMRAGGKRQPKQPIQKTDLPMGTIPQAAPTPQPVRDQRFPIQSSSQQTQKENGEEQAPKDWYEPKIFKGTSVK